MRRGEEGGGGEERRGGFGRMDELVVGAFFLAQVWIVSSCRGITGFAI